MEKKEDSCCVLLPKCSVQDDAESPETSTQTGPDSVITRGNVTPSSLLTSLFSLLPSAETPAVEPGDGERRAIRPGELHLRGAEQVRRHHPHLPAGCAR